MSVIKDLRPVEAVVFLDQAWEEEPTLQDLLSTIIVYLAIEGYLQPIWQSSLASRLVSTGIGYLEVTEKGKEKTSSLRAYENTCLEMIARARARDLYFTVKRYDFSDLLVSRGFLRTQQKKRASILQLLTHDWDLGKPKPIDYLAGVEYERAIQELDHLKGRIQSAIQTRTSDKYMISMSYAFPSIKSNKIFSRYVKQDRRAKRPAAPDYVAIAVTAAEAASRLYSETMYPSEFGGG